MQFAAAEHVLGQLFGYEAGVRAQVLAVLRAIDTDDEPWRVDGAVSLDAWLAQRFGIAKRSAGELVDVSRRLADLPQPSANAADSSGLIRSHMSQSRGCFSTPAWTCSSSARAYIGSMSWA